MRVCIHRGTDEIGGTCIEVESGGARVVLDVGLPLDADPEEMVEMHPIPGFDAPDPSLLGVVISHPHQDHYGLAHRLPEQTTYLIGEAAENILAAAQVFSPGGIRLEHTMHLRHREPITLGPFTLTPYPVDHSAYDAYALLVEADGQRLFYSGDLRGHGRKAALFEQLVGHPPQDVDLLLMEGTAVQRAGSEAGFRTERDLEDRLVRQLKSTPGMPLVWCSGQNIDRLVTVFRACVRAGRRLILDMYTAHVLRATGNRNIPQAHWDGVDVYLPYFQRRRVKRLEAFDVSGSYSRWRIYPEQLAGAATGSVMLFRPSMTGDVERAGCLDGARLIYSLWEGYLRREPMRPFLRWLKENEIPLDRVHTSGHAGTGDLRRLRQAFAGADLVPIHTEHADDFEALFGQVLRPRDGQWLDVGGG